MEIRSAVYTGSYVTVESCPSSALPEFAFIGRSNVGKSSLINMLCNSKNLVHVSQQPGKTQSINFFLINETFHFVDLPGYGFAVASRKRRQEFRKMITGYLDRRQQLHCLFVLIDIRHRPQAIDLEFIHDLGTKGIPFVLVFTKADKTGRTEQEQHVQIFSDKLLESWETLPQVFITSSVARQGRDEVLRFIDETMRRADLENDTD